MSHDDNEKQSTGKGKTASAGLLARPRSGTRSAKVREIVPKTRRRGGAPASNRSIPGKGLSEPSISGGTAAGAGKRRKFWPRLLFMCCGIALFASAAFGYFVIYVPVQRVSSAVNRIFVTPVPVRRAPVVVPRTPQKATSPTPVSARFPDWNKQEPVNVLLIGVDARTGDMAPLADTQAIVHIDPSNKTATLVSIPRDLWVDIPGFDQGRINSAYQLGSLHADTVPGGGPGLAMSTVEQDFGIPINYYARVDFAGFEAIVDTLGGITVDVPGPLADNTYPYGDYGLTRIYVQAGLQHMDGRTALEYARSRHADNDLARNTRQRDVLLAIRQRALNLDILPRLSDLADQVSESLRTDLSLSQVGSLLQLSRQIPSQSVSSVVIDATATDEVILPSGADVLKPKWEVIRPRIAEAFADPKLGQEAARIEVQNGTLVDGEGAGVRDLLLTRGLYAPDVSVAPDRGKHKDTTIIDFTDGTKPETLAYLEQVLGIAAANVAQAPASDAPLSQVDGKPIDILVVTGDDRLGK